MPSGTAEHEIGASADARSAIDDDCSGDAVECDASDSSTSGVGVCASGDVTSWVSAPEDSGCATGKPECGGRICGSDGCGGSCGLCPAGQTCIAAGVACVHWFKGNPHTHSTLSDGANTPQEVSAHYQAHGYDWLVLSDHGAWSDFAQFSTASFLAINGAELHTTIGHRWDFNALDIGAVIATGRRPVQTVIDSIAAAGGIAVLDHPTRFQATLTELWPLTGLQFMEMYNRADPSGMDEVLWDALLTSGKGVLGLASDDCHNIATRAGFGWVVVRADELSLEAIRNALFAGDFYASTGVTLTDLTVTDDWISVESEDGQLVEFIGAGGKVLATEPGTRGIYAFDGSERYVRVRVTGLTGHAYTQPVFRDRFVQDPYADAIVETNGLESVLLTPILGPPYPGQVPATLELHSVRLGPGQSIALDMGENEEVVDREGADLYVEEVDEEDSSDASDSFTVDVSVDASSWISLGESAGDSYFDLSPSGLAQARYVRISSTAGHAELDAVVALDPVFFDPHADTVVEATEVISGTAPAVLGAPVSGAVPMPWSLYAVQIGGGGQIVVDMGPAEEVRDKTGFDLAVFEIDVPDDAAPDPYQVFVSSDGAEWLFVGDGCGAAPFDIAPTGLTEARYVRLQVEAGSAEFDGITAI